MYNVPKDLLDAFRATPDIYRALLEGCTQEKAQSSRGGDEDWSVVEVMCHMRDAEERGLQRTRQMLAEDDPFLAGYDQDAWAQERNYAGANLHEVLASYLSLREEYVAELEKLTPEQWQRTGRHEEQGQITVEGHLLHLVAHDAIHAAQIARQLGKA